MGTKQIIRFSKKDSHPSLIFILQFVKNHTRNMKLIAYYISELMNDSHISISTMRYKFLLRDISFSEVNDISYELFPFKL